jgi:hypothetical protein
MTITDLKQTCPACKGSGQQPAINDGGIPQILVAGRCLRCAGRGFLLTDLGQDVWKALRPFIADLIDERLGAQAAERPAPSR